MNYLIGAVFAAMLALGIGVLFLAGLVLLVGQALMGLYEN